MIDHPYQFKDSSLLELALTHASLGEGENNERLEFLGDAALDLIVADELYRWHSGLPEGDLTEFKAWVVSRTVLAQAARKLGLDDAARMGSGMRNRALPRSVLANLYEAVLGAVYLDGGFAAAQIFALETLKGPLERVRKSQPGPNPKQVLQQRSQVLTGKPPNYIVLDQRGKAHARAFLVAAEVNRTCYPSAWGRTRKEAERWAAHEALIVQDAEAALSGENLIGSAHQAPGSDADFVGDDNSKTDRESTGLATARSRQSARSKTSRKQADTGSDSAAQTAAVKKAGQESSPIPDDASNGDQENLPDAP